MAEPFIGQLIIAGFDFAPRNYAKCDGQLLSINQHQALFSLVGTQFGGDGRTSFGLPDLRGRVPMHAGNQRRGERGGQEAVVLTSAHMPAHTHTLSGTANNASSPSPTGNVLANFPRYAAPANLAPMHTTSIANTGGSQMHENRQPSLGLNFCIALEGIYPSRP